MLVSAIIPAYNSAYVRDAIVSILDQTFRNIEVIVVDDGSPGDAIRKICMDFPDVRYIRQNNAGPSAGRNRGIREAKGEWIAFLDDDDTWLPQKIEKQLQLIARLPVKERIGLVYTGQYLFQDNTVFGSKVDEADGLIYPYLLFGNFIGTCSSIIVPKHVFDKVGGYDETLICSQDFELYLRIAREFEIYSVHEPLIRYRTRPDQISKDPTLNNSDDAEILKRQKVHVAPELFEKVRNSHRRASSLRYKETAYDSLFRLKSRSGYWKWLWRSVTKARRPPSLASLTYLALSIAPDFLIDRIAEFKIGESKNVGGGAASPARYRKIAEEFEWAELRHQSISGLAPLTSRNSCL